MTINGFGLKELHIVGMAVRLAFNIALAAGAILYHTCALTVWEGV